MNALHETYILTNILQHTQLGEDFRNFCLVSHHWLQVMRQLFRKWHVFNNHLEKLTHGTHYALIPPAVINPNLTWEMWKFHKTQIEDKRYIKYALGNPQLIWHFISMDANLRISENVHDICSFQRVGPARPDTVFLSMNPEITWDIVSANPQITWDYRSLSFNKSIISNRHVERSWSIVASAIRQSWDFIKIVQVLGPNWDIILANKNCDWDREYLTRIAPPAILNTGEHSAFWNVAGLVRNPHCFTDSGEMINIHKLTGLRTVWNVVTEGRISLLSFSISANPGITWEMVLKYTEIPWIFSELSANPGILRGSLDVVKNNPRYGWVYKRITYNPSLWTFADSNSNRKSIWNYVVEDPKRGWDWDYLSEHLPFNIILNNPEYNWNTTVLSQRLDLTADIVNENPLIKWVPNAFTTNRFSMYGSQGLGVFKK
jgi:hypothetical protein